VPDVRTERNAWFDYFDDVRTYTYLVCRFHNFYVDYIYLYIYAGPPSVIGASGAAVPDVRTERNAWFDYFDDVRTYTYLVCRFHIFM